MINQGSTLKSNQTTLILRQQQLKGNKEVSLALAV